MIRCPVCSEPLKRESLFARDNFEDVIYSCNHHGIIFERYEEIYSRADADDSPIYEILRT